jgi:hypothetical protein
LELRKTLNLHQAKIYEQAKHDAENLEIRMKQF